jgi:hypothetical protein
MLSRPQRHSAAERVMSNKKKNSSDTIGNGVRKPLAYRAVLTTTSSTLNFPTYFENSHRQHTVTAKQSNVLPVHRICMHCVHFH